MDRSGWTVEAFQARTGVVLIRGFTTTGTVSALYGATVTVDAREFRDESISSASTNEVFSRRKDVVVRSERECD
jgi:hypothetical protein